MTRVTASYRLEAARRSRRCRHPPATLSATDHTAVRYRVDSRLLLALYLQSAAAGASWRVAVIGRRLLLKSLRAEDADALPPPAAAAPFVSAPVS